MTSTETAPRTIEQVLDIRVRAAEIRVVERAAVLAKVTRKVTQAVFATPELQDDLDTSTDALRIARDALALARQERASQQGEPVEPVKYEPSTSQTMYRYTGVLMMDNPELTIEQATLQAHQDERLRFTDYSERFLSHDDDDQAGRGGAGGGPPPPPPNREPFLHNPPPGAHDHDRPTRDDPPARAGRGLAGTAHRAGAVVPGPDGGPGGRERRVLLLPRQPRPRGLRHVRRDRQIRPRDHPPGLPTGDLIPAE
jgi:hypothetical protein